MTGCLEIERQYHKRLIFVSVGIRNLGQQAAEFDTEHFIFVDREGRSFDPVDVRSDFNYAPWLLPRSGLIPPGKWRVGWLTFDGRVGAFVAQSLDYVDHAETLRVVFDGNPHTKTIG